MLLFQFTADVNLKAIGKREQLTQLPSKELCGVSFVNMRSVLQ